LTKPEMGRLQERVGYFVGLWSEKGWTVALEVGHAVYKLSRGSRKSNQDHGCRLWFGTGHAENARYDLCAQPYPNVFVVSQSTGLVATTLRNVLKSSRFIAPPPVKTGTTYCASGTPPRPSAVFSGITMPPSGPSILASLR